MVGTFRASFFQAHIFSVYEVHFFWGFFSRGFHCISRFLDCSWSVSFFGIHGNHRTYNPGFSSLGFWWPVMKEIAKPDKRVTRKPAVPTNMYDKWYKPAIPGVSVSSIIASNVVLSKTGATVVLRISVVVRRAEVVMFDAGSFSSRAQLKAIQ